mmetsp:Transcript_14555/g.39870  ORF Transcript_14555/g.39870 Transcript_14555/m.39870 type:complete len:333 (+) Transcript_14555:130-1128(+)
MWLNDSIRAAHSSNSPLHPRVAAAVADACALPSQPVPALLATAANVARQHGRLVWREGEAILSQEVSNAPAAAHGQVEAVGVAERRVDQDAWALRAPHNLRDRGHGVPDALHGPSARAVHSLGALQHRRPDLRGEDRRLHLDQVEVHGHGLGAIEPELTVVGAPRLRRPTDDGGLGDQRVDRQQEVPVEVPGEEVHPHVAISQPVVVEAARHLGRQVLPEVYLAAGPGVLVDHVRKQRLADVGLHGRQSHALLQVVVEERELEGVARAVRREPPGVVGNGLQHAAGDGGDDERPELARGRRPLPLEVRELLGLVLRPSRLEVLRPIAPADLL